VKTLRYAMFFFAIIFISPVTHAEIIMAPTVATEKITTYYEIAPQTYMSIPLPSSNKANSIYTVRITSDNKVYKDITAFLVDEENKKLFSRGMQYRRIGTSKAVAPFTIKGAIKSNSRHYLVLDNTYANFMTKKLNVSITAESPADEVQSERLKDAFLQMYKGLKGEYVFKDFDIYVEPCGQVNAFSESFTSGNIHICTELLDNISKAKNLGAFQFIFFHELGHTMLGLWGLPANNNEDIADEFATFLMLQGDAAQGVLLSKSLDFWKNRDSVSEANNMILNGDRHSLSVQRIRNIEENIRNSSRFCKRWTQLVYPHMTTNGLNEIIQSPNGCSNPELAKSLTSKSSTIELSTGKALKPVAIQANSSVEERLLRLKNLLDKGLITQKEYTSKKEMILEQL